MPYNRQIPDAPIAGSMLPRAASVDTSDILVLIKPNNPLGQRNKSLELGGLFSSDLFKFRWASHPMQEAFRRFVRIPVLRLNPHVIVCLRMQRIIRILTGTSTAPHLLKLGSRPCKVA